MPTYDSEVIVVGAGPAGTSAATVLGRAGHSVLLLDSAPFPRDKTCGDGISYLCREPLQRLEVLDQFRECLPYRTIGVSMYFTNGTEVTVRRALPDDQSIVYVLPRYDFDKVLLDTAMRQRTVAFRDGVKVIGLIRQGSVVRGVRTAGSGGGEELHAPLVLDASGVNSMISGEAGVGHRDSRRYALAVRGYYDDCQGLEDVIEIYFDQSIMPGYFWIFPTSETTANVGVGTFRTVVGSSVPNLRMSLEAFMSEHPVARRKMGQARLRGPLKGGKIPLAMDAGASRVRDGLMVLGDAGGFVNPITAEGIPNAMKSGILAAEVGGQALIAGDCSATALSRFDSEWRRAFGPQFASSAFLMADVSQQMLAGYLLQGLQNRADIGARLADPGLRYELMLKLLVQRTVL